MAQWSDPRVTGTQSSLAGVGTSAGDVAVDAGLRAHMLKVYNYMASGVLLTGIVAMLFAQTELAQNLKNLLYFTHHERIAAALRAAGAENIRLVARLDMHTLQRATE